MKLTTKQQAILISYAHGVVVAILPLIMVGEKDWTKYGYALVGGVFMPVLRALNKKDSAFGLVADAIEAKVPEVVAAEVASNTPKA